MSKISYKEFSNLNDWLMLTNKDGSLSGFNKTFDGVECRLVVDKNHWMITIIGEKESVLFGSDYMIDCLEYGYQKLTEE